jgi:hypothetical protein
MPANARNRAISAHGRNERRYAGVEDPTMTRGSNRTAGFAAAVAFALALLITGGHRAAAQSPAETAAKLSGNWTLNVELTPASAGRGRGRGSPSFAISAAPAQRGGGGGRGRGGGEGQPGTEASAPLMAEEAAAQAALSVLHQVPTELTIEATAETVTFREPRGEWRFTIDGKNSSMAVPGGTLRTKTKWDRATLHQEFSSAQRKLVKLWSVDANGRLVLTEKVESISFNSESKALFDRR